MAKFLRGCFYSLAFYLSSKPMAKTSACTMLVNMDIQYIGRLRWTGASPTRSGPEGSSRNEFFLGHFSTFRLQYMLYT